MICASFSPRSSVHLFVYRMRLSYCFATQSPGSVSQRSDDVVADENYDHGPDNRTRSGNADILRAASSVQSDGAGEDNDDRGVNEGFKEMHREIAVQDGLLD